MTPLIILFLLGIMTLLFITIGMTRNDLAHIRSKRMVRKHPNARRFRERPTVHVIINGTPTSECLRSIQKNRYKKLIVTTKENLPTDAVVLYIDSDTILEPRSILDAVQQIASTTGRKTISIVPMIPFGADTMALLRAYSALVRLPFDMARSGFGIASRNSLTSNATKNQLFDTMARIIKFVNLLVFMYACYAAANLNQSELVLVYLSSTSFWLVWSIIRYPYFSFTKKTALLLLSPVSFVYLIYLTIAAPFVVSSRQASHQNAMMKV